MAALGQRDALGVVCAGRLAACQLAGVHGDVTVGSGVASSAETGKVVWSRQVLAHGTLRAGIVLAIGLFQLALEAAVARRTLAPEALLKVHALASVVARLARAFVYLNLAILALETTRAVALRFV